MSSPLRWRLIRGSFLVAGLVLATLASALKEEPPQLLLEKATKLELVDGDLKGAIAIDERILSGQGVPRTVMARALLHLGECHEKLGHAEARKAYERLVREFPDQTEEAGRARARLATLGEHDTAMQVRQVWADPDGDLFGGPTRDGRYVTFQDASEDLAVRDLSTGLKRRLTNKGPRSLEFAMVSAPSPGGQEVAYAWYNKHGIYDLRIVGLDGSSPRVLFANADVEYLEPTDWSPDGKSLLAVFYGKDKKTEIVLVAVRDGSVRVLKAFDQQAPEGGSFSPDGRFVAYHFPQGPSADEHDIFVLPVDGGRETPLVQHPANDVVFGWTPDGKGILFGSDRGGTMSAWWIRTADGKPTGVPELIKPDMGQDVWPMGFTRDGSWYYSVRTGMTDVYVAELDPASGRVLVPPVLATQRFAGSNSKPDWSSDGRQLVFLSKRGPGAWGARAICVRATESGEVREVASRLNRVAWVRWSPDGRYLLAAASVDGGFPICRIDVQTGEFERVVPNALGWPAVWSPDGREIFFTKYNKAAKALSVVVRDFGAEQEKELFSVADPSYYCASLALSRDGRQLAFAVDETESQSKVLKVLPAEGGEPRDVLRGAEMPFPGSVAWTPDGLNLVFTGRPNPRGSKTELWLVPVQGGEPRKLDLAADNIRELRLHPDGRHIAYTAGKDRQEVWALSNFLPAAEATAAR